MIMAQNDIQTWVKYIVTASVGNALVVDQLLASPPHGEEWFNDTLLAFRRDAVETLSVEDCCRLFTDNPDTAVIRRPTYISENSWTFFIKGLLGNIKVFRMITTDITKLKQLMF